MNIIKNSITQKEYTQLVNKVDNIGNSETMTLAQSDYYKCVLGVDTDKFIYIDLVDKSTGSMVNNVLIKPDGSLGGRGVDNRTEFLYDNFSCTNGTITFNKEIITANYEYLEIFFKAANNNYHFSTRYIPSPSQPSLALTITYPYDSGIYWKTAIITINSKTLTFSKSSTYGTSYDSVVDESSIYIRRIVGHTTR